MKRLSWLLGAVAGAIALPISMWLCLWIWMRLDTSPVLAPSLVWALFEDAIIRDGLLIGAGLGVLSASLMFGRRTLGIRTLSAGAGVSVVTFCCQWFWHPFHSLGAYIVFSVPTKTLLLLRFVCYAVPILWGLTIFFFALLVRPRHARQTV